MTMAIFQDFFAILYKFNFYALINAAILIFKEHRMKSQHKETNKQTQNQIQIFNEILL